MECFPDEQNSGDSYTSTKFDIHGEQPNLGNPLGNPPYPGDTSSGGPNYVDYLTTTYNRSYIQTYNFGYGGGTVDHSLLPSTFSPYVLSFDQQVQQEFIPTYGDKVAVPWSAANSLVTIFFGINDVLLALPKHDDSLNYAIIRSYEKLVHQVRLTILLHPLRTGLTQKTTALRYRFAQLRLHERSPARPRPWLT